MRPRKVVTSEINGREIGRGTIVRWLSITPPVKGVVEKLLTDEKYAWPLATVIFGERLSGWRGKCKRITVPVARLEPIGEAKRIPKCSGRERVVGAWVRPSPRKHRARETEIGREIRSLQEALALGGDHDEEIRKRLVILDRKLERLPVGPLRKHRGVQ